MSAPKPSRWSSAQAGRRTLPATGRWRTAGKAIPTDTNGPTSGGAVTCLQCCGVDSETNREHHARKRWYIDANGVEALDDCSVGFLFKVVVKQVSSIFELAALISELESDPKAFIIRGEPLPHVDRTRPVRRTKLDRPHEPANFGDVKGGLRWGMIDFDRVPLPRGLNPAECPERVVRFLVTLLPEYFRNASCYWQFSAKAGMDGHESEVSAHLFFFFSRQVEDKELTRWAEQWKNERGVEIDAAVFRTIQPHFIAAPLFEDGIIDPLPLRSGLLQGDRQAVQFPKLVTAPVSRRAQAKTGLSNARGFEAILRGLGDPPGNPRGRGFNAPLLAATASYAARFGRSGTNKSALKTLLRARIEAAAARPDRDVSRYLSDGYLDRLIESALMKFGEDAIQPHWNEHSLPIAAAEREMAAKVEEFFRNALPKQGRP